MFSSKIITNLHTVFSHLLIYREKYAIISLTSLANTELFNVNNTNTSEK